jgi:NADH-quinone oxidoreductase subunit J
MTESIFYALGAIAIGSALLCVLQRSPLAAAMWLVGTMLSLAGMFLILGAPFIAAIQVLVYAGAIMVLFLFVIMLLNLGHPASDMRGRAAWVVTLIGVGAMSSVLLGLAAYGPERLARELTGTSDLPPSLVFAAGDAARRAAETQGVVGGVAGPLFETYLVPFEVTSILLLAAIVGAVVLAKRRV